MKEITLIIDEKQAGHLLLGLEYYLEHLELTQKDFKGMDIEDIDTFEMLIDELKKQGIESE